MLNPSPDPLNYGQHLKVTFFRMLRLFVICVLIGAVVTSALIHLMALDAGLVADASIQNLRWTQPLHQNAVDCGIDEGIVLFLHNGIYSLGIMSFLLFASLMNPRNAGKFPAALRRQMIGSSTPKPGRMNTAADRMMNVIRSIRSVRDTNLKQICVFTHLAPKFCLSCAGTMIGITAGAFSSHWGAGLLAAATLPHGVFEIPALVLAATLPSATYAFMRKDAENDSSDEAYRKMNLAMDSGAFRTMLLTIAATLLAAGMVEAHLTPMIVDMIMPA